MIYSISKPTASLLGLLTTSLSITTSNAASDCSPPLAPSSSSASSSEIVSSFYPPGINSTSYITNFTSDSLGGIDAYTAPTRGPTAGTPYGVYDYCSMPHLRKEQYQIPAAVQGNGTQSKGRLVYLEYLQRHQRRTAYNILPGGENQAYDCDSVYPYLYAGPSCPNLTPPVPMHASIYTDPSNPFSTGVNTTCQFPQLTIGGLEDGIQHGKDLASIYLNLDLASSLFPSTPDPAKTFFRSSSSALTQSSAGGVFRGLYPDYTSTIPLHQQQPSVDTINAEFASSCPAIASTLADITSTPEWQDHLTVTASLRSTFATMLGANDSSWQSTFDHFADNFQSRLCNGYELPCSLDSASSDGNSTSGCVTAEMALQVFRAGDWEWNYYWRANPYATRYIQLVEGMFIGEIVGRLQAVRDGTSELVYEHVFAHDGDVGPVLGALGIVGLRWPGMGSNVAIEVWELDGDHFARVLYSGHPIHTIHGILDWIPIADLIAILSPFIPEDILSLCAS